MMVEAYYCTLAVYSLYVQKSIKAVVIMALVELPIMGRIFGVW